MTRRKIVPWLVMGPEPHFAHCERCGAAVPPPELPMPIDAFQSYASYVSDLHRHCVAPEVTHDA